MWRNYLSEDRAVERTRCASESAGVSMSMAPPENSTRAISATEVDFHPRGSLPGRDNAFGF